MAHRTDRYWNAPTQTATMPSTPTTSAARGNAHGRPGREWRFWGNAVIPGQAG